MTTPDPIYPYFITGMFIFLISTGIWLHFIGRDLDKKPSKYYRPRKDIRKWDLETNYIRKTHKPI